MHRPRGAEYSKDWLNGLSAGKTTMFWPEKGHETWRKWRTAKEECSETGPCRWTGEENGLKALSKGSQGGDGQNRVSRNISTQWLKTNQHMSKVERLKGQPGQKGYAAPDLAFCLLMSEQVFLTSAVTQRRSRTLWNYCHMLLTGTAAFCIGMKLESVHVLVYA